MACQGGQQLGRKIRGADDRIHGEGRGPLHLVAQFAHIAGPVIGQQALLGGRGQAQGRAFHIVRMLGQQVPGQQQDVVAPFMQGRERQLGHIEAVVQVLPETPLGHGLPQIHIGGRDDLDVHGHGPGAAHAQDFPLLEHAQQLGLIGQGHVRQLVQEERPARSLFHQAAAGADAGGHTFFDAEHLAFEQGIRDGRAVDGHKGGIAPGGVVVDGLGEDLLARAGRPQDQGVDGPSGDGQGLGHHLPHGRTAADDAADVVLLLQGLHHLPVLFMQAQAAFFQLLRELVHLSSNSARWNSRASTLTIIMPKASARRSSSGEELPSRVRANRASSSAGRPQARSSHRRISRARGRAFFSCMAYPWRRDCTQRSTSATGPMRSWGI